jgi:hypothetical protein
VTLFVVLVVLVTVVGLGTSLLIGSRIAKQRQLPRTAAVAVVLAVLVLMAAAVALAIGGPTPDDTCDGGNSSLRNDIAGVIAVGAIPSLLLALALTLGAVLVSPRAWRLYTTSLVACLAAVGVDLVALTQSVRICLE